MTPSRPCLAALATLVVSLPACGNRLVTIGALEPTPALDLPRQPTRLGLDLAPGTADTLRDEPDGFPVVEVREFRRTLTSGFERGFGRAFALSAPAEADRVLRLEVHRLAFVSESEARASRHTAARGDLRADVVLAHGAHEPRPPGKRPPRRRVARLEFKASLHDGATEVATISGHAVAEVAADRRSRAIANSIASAVAVLYQRVGRELIVRHSAQRDDAWRRSP